MRWIEANKKPGVAPKISFSSCQTRSFVSIALNAPAQVFGGREVVRAGARRSFFSHMNKLGVTIVRVNEPMHPWLRFVEARMCSSGRAGSCVETEDVAIEMFLVILL